MDLVRKTWGNYGERLKCEVVRGFFILEEFEEWDMGCASNAAIMDVIVEKFSDRIFVKYTRMYFVETIQNS